jgi:hypothetical protein
MQKTLTKLSWFTSNLGDDH